MERKRIVHGQPDTTLRSRRAFLWSAASVMATLGGVVCTSSGRAGQTESGDCFDEPAFELFYAWDTGDLVYPGPGESSPPSHWEMTDLPGGALPWFIPPGWSVSTYVAENIERDGTIDWQRRVRGMPLLSLTRVESEDGSALFEEAIGTLDGYALYIRDVSDMAVASLVGADARLRSVCYLDNEGATSNPIWRRLERVGRDLLYSFGGANALPDPNIPTTVFWYFNFLGPRRQMEDLMLEAFIPLMDQYRVRGEGDEPTPTPTPTPEF